MDPSTNAQDATRLPNNIEIMLIGHYIQKITKKGQTALPSKLKNEIGEDLILTRWYEGALAIFNLDNWKKIVEQATLGSSISTSARDTERFLLGGAYILELDSQGRFVIPQAPREYANFDKEVVYVGLGNRIEIWDKKLWNEREKDIIENAERLLERAQGVWNEH